MYSSTCVLKESASMNPSIRIAPKKCPIPLPTLWVGISISCRRVNGGANGPQFAPLKTQLNISTMTAKQ